MAKKEKAIELVKKALALAGDNPNENEAIAAALKAQELMAKYNITEIDLMDRVECETIEESIFNFKNNINDCDNHKWKFQLATIIAKNFRCEVYCSGNHIIKFYGYKKDSMIAKEVFGSMYVIGDKLGRRYKERAKKETGTTKGVYNSFILGFLKGIKEALDKQCTALMIVTPKKVKDSYQELAKSFTRTINSGVKTSNFDNDAFQSGIYEGRNAMQAKQLAG